MEETMEALHELVKQGKVRALGASAMYGYQFYNMQQIAKDHGWTPFSTMENHYNLLYREDERELIPICKQMNVSLMPYRSAGKGPACNWRCEVYDGHIHVHNDRSTSSIVCILWFDSEYGGNWNCHCYVFGLERERDYFYMEIPEGKVEDISGNLRK